MVLDRIRSRNARASRVATTLSRVVLSPDITIPYANLLHHCDPRQPPSFLLHLAGRPERLCSKGSVPPLESRDLPDRTDEPIGHAIIFLTTIFRTVLRLSSGHKHPRGIDIVEIASASCSGMLDRHLKYPQAVSALSALLFWGGQTCHAGYGAGTALGSPAYTGPCGTIA